MTDLETRLSYSEDTQAKRKALKGLDDIRLAQKAVSDAAKAGNVSIDKAVQQISQLGTQYSKMSRALRESGVEFRETAKGVQLLTDAEEVATERAKRLQEELSKVQSRGAGVGQLEGVFRDLGGGIGALGGTGGQQAFGFAAEAVGAGKGISEFKEILAGIPNVAQGATQAIGLGGFAGELGTLVPALGAGGAAMATLAAVALPIVAAIGAVTFALDLMRKNAEAAAAAEKRRVELTNQQIATENEFQQLVQSGNVEEIIAKREEAWQNLATNTEQLSAASTRLDELRQQERELSEARLEAYQNLNPAAFLDYSNQLGEVQAQIQAQTENFDALGATQAELMLTTQEADAALSNFNQTEITAAQNVEALTEVQRQLTDVESQRTQAIKEQEAALQRIDQLEAQRVQLIEQRADQAVFAEQQSALESKFAQEDESAETQAFYDELTSIAADGREKVKQIELSLSSLRAERSEALAEVDAKGQDKLNKLNQDYFSQQLKENRNFHKETQRLESDNKKARLRLLEDINERLADAQRDNNVIAFLEAQREGAKQVRQSAEDANEAEKRRLEDFAARQEEAAAQQQQRLAETIAGIAEERAKVEESFNEKRNQLEQSRQQELAAIQERTAAAVARYQAEEAQETQQADRQRQRDDLRKAREEELFNRQISAIETRKQAELAALDAIQIKVNNIVAAAQALQAQQSQLSGQSATSSGASSVGSSSYFFPNSGGGGFSAVAFQHGGITRGGSPLLAVLGDNPSGTNEAHIPFRESEGLPAALNRYGLGGGAGGRAVNVTVNMPVTVGDIATKSQVDSAIEGNIELMLREFMTPLLVNALDGRAS